MSNQAKRLSNCAAERLAQCRGGVVPPASLQPEVLAVVAQTDSIFPETQLDHRDAIELAPVGTELIDRAHFTRLQAEVSALQQRLNIADQRVCDLQSELTKMRSGFSNLRDVARDCEHLASSYCGSIDGVEEHGGDDHEDPTCAIWHRLYYAMFDADKALAHQPVPAPNEEDWHMNPCKQGHGDVGACGGKAFCHTCDETITATTTQAAFEQWNSAHPPSAKAGPRCNEEREELGLPTNPACAACGIGSCFDR